VGGVKRIWWWFLDSWFRCYVLDDWLGLVGGVLLVSGLCLFFRFSLCGYGLLMQFGMLVTVLDDRLVRSLCNMAMLALL
jgi:hypothetical protein